MNVSSAIIRHVFFGLSFLLLAAPIATPHSVMAQSQKPGVSYEEKKRQANDIAVTVVVSGLSCTCARFTEDIRNVVNDLGPDGLRVLPVLGVGGLQNLNDVLFLKNVDMAVVDEDNLRLLKKKDPVLYANVEQRVQYITKLYNSEFQVLARNDIKSYDDLRGKKVNFNLKDSQTEVTADTVFNALNIPVQRSYYDNDEALKRLMSGDISAMIILTGAPQAMLAKVKKEDGVHFLPLDQESLPNHELDDLFANYLPADLTHEHYPNLIAEGTTVPTIANRALLVAYAWPEDRRGTRGSPSSSTRSSARSTNSTTRRGIPSGARSIFLPKCPAGCGLSPRPNGSPTHHNQAVSANPDSTIEQSSSELKLAFDKFMQAYPSSSGQRRLSSGERELLFREVHEVSRAGKGGTGGGTLGLLEAFTVQHIRRGPAN